MKNHPKGLVTPEYGTAELIYTSLFEYFVLYCKWGSDYWHG